VADIVSLKDRGKYQGILGSVLGISSIIGPILGGLLIDNYSSWRLCFFVSPPIGIIVLVLIYFVMDFKASNPVGSVIEKLKHVDFIGAFLIICFSVTFLMPLQLAGTLWNWVDPHTIVLLCSAPPIAGLFFYTQIKWSKNPILPPILFKKPAVPLILAMCFCSGLCFMTLVFYIPMFLQFVFGNSATASGLKTIPMFIGVTTLSITSGQIVSRTDRCLAFFYIAPIFLIIGYSLLSSMSDDITIPILLIYLFISGMGVGCLVQVRVLSRRQQ
jgi:MFS family permease